MSLFARFASCTPRNGCVEAAGSKKKKHNEDDRFVANVMMTSQ